MPLQIAFFNESGVTNYANMRPLIVVNTSTNDATLPAEMLITDIAGIELSVGMPGHMLV